MRSEAVVRFRFVRLVLETGRVRRLDGHGNPSLGTVQAGSANQLWRHPVLDAGGQARPARTGCGRERQHLWELAERRFEPNPVLSSKAVGTPPGSASKAQSKSL